MRVVPLAAIAAVATACGSAAAAPEKLRATVAPSPGALTTRTWSPTISLREDGKPASARLELTIRSTAARRSFRPRATRRGSYRARVVFPSDGRWRWTLTGGGSTLAQGAISVSTPVGFELPYDLALAPGGTVLFLDRSRVLALDLATRRLRVHATTPSDELVGMERLADGTLFVTDLPGGRVLRIDPTRRVTVVARIPAPVALVADAQGTTLWVASIAEGVGVVRVDTASGRTEPFADVHQPHGIDRDAAGNFYVHDGHAVSRVDGATGAVSPFADVDAFDLRIVPDGTIYGIEGTPAGGRVVRIAQDGSVTAVAGTNRLGPHRDGPALEAEILPSAVELAPDGALLVAQIEPLPAIRRVDLATGLMTTLVRGRR